MKYLTGLMLLAMVGLAPATSNAGSVKPGDLITSDNASLVADLVSPGNFYLVKQGMHLKIVPTGPLEWPPPYKTATEKYAPQVRLNEKGELQNYVAGQPFPLLDPNDPQVATKVMWNFSFRPQYTDDVDIRDVEVTSFRAHSPFPGPIEHFTIGHFAFYNSMGRTEVAPIPTDPKANGAGIRYRFGAFPFTEPAELYGFGLIRQRNKDPNIDDNAWYYSPGNRAPRRVRASDLSDAVASVQCKGQYSAADDGGGCTYANNLDPDSYFGFSAKIENYDYKLLGIKPMLAGLRSRREHAGYAVSV
jgi:hypothetical protein